MKYYEKMVEMGCFTRENLTTFTGNYKTSDTILYNYLEKGYIRRIRRNLYAAVNLVDYELTVDKFQIASAINSDSYVSHRTAFEFHGCANQVSYQVDVSSKKAFESFLFEGYTYSRINESISVGIIDYPNHLRVTGIERTILDSIDQFEKTMGLEELLRCIALVPAVDERILLSYLQLYDKQIMYQKTGFILYAFQNNLRLSDDFFLECKEHVGRSTRYLTTSREGCYNVEWRIVAPKDLLNIIESGVDSIDGL